MATLTIKFPKPPSNSLMLEDNRELTQPWNTYFDQLAQAIDVIVPDAPSPGTYPTGIIDGSDAPAGDIGEYLEATTVGFVTLTSATPADVITLDLTAGDWDVTAWAGFAVASGPANYLSWGIDGTDTFSTGDLASAGGWTGPQRHNLTSTTTVALRANADFGGGVVVTVVGLIRARRM